MEAGPGASQEPARGRRLDASVPGPDPLRAGAGEPQVEAAGQGFGLLYVAAFLAYGDRYVIPPLLVSMSRDLGESLAAVTAVATGYFFFYGLMQPVHGMLSDRFGRVRVMRAALVGAGVANLAAAVAPSLGFLVPAKAAAAGFTAAILPTSLVYVGDKVRFALRQRVIANVLAAGAVGTVGAIAAGGLLGRFASWRLAFLIPGLFALGLSIPLRRLPESLSGERGAGPLAQVSLVLRRPWAAFLILLAVGEGVVMLAFLTFLAPALEARGESAAVAGVVVATYGVAVFVGLQSVKRLVATTSISPPRLMSTGGVVLVSAYLVAALSQGVVNVLVASVLIGFAYAFLHSSLQTWATEAVPEARGTATSFFVAGVYTGAAIGTTAVSGLADSGRYRVLFLVAAAVTVPLFVIASWARSRYRPSEPGDSVK